jgi:hypothetical protein
MYLETSTNSISGKIESIIKEAQEELFIISPYIQLKNWENIKQAINFALKNDVKFTLIVRTPKSKDIEKILEQIKDFHEMNFKLYMVENLHAKIYYNKSEGLITSMNFYLHSAENNYELGVVVQESDENEKGRLEKYIQFLLEMGELYVTEEDITQEQELSKTNGIDELQQVEFRVYHKAMKWYHVETPNKQDHKLEIDEIPTLEEEKSYRAKAKINWREFSYGFNVFYTQIKDIIELDHFCVACKRPTAKKEILCSTCKKFKDQSKIPLNPHYCHKCGYEWYKITFNRPLCKWCYHKYGNKL